MLAFRSEGEIRRWCEAHGRAVGATFSPDLLWSLARVWYDDRLQLAWRRRTVGERQSLLEQVGLSGPLWRIEP